MHGERRCYREQGVEVSGLSAATRIARAAGDLAAAVWGPPTPGPGGGSPLRAPATRGWVDSQLLDEYPPPVPVCLERLRLAPGPVEGEHQLAAQALTERVLQDQPLELPHEVQVPTEGEVHIDPALERSEAELLQPGDGRLGEGLIREVCERRAAPERQR